MKTFSILEIKSSIGEIKTSPSDLFEDDDGRIAQKTGIQTLHRTKKSAYELAVDATDKLDKIEFYRKNIKYLIYVTQSPSFYLPNHASRIQQVLNLSKETMCFDINQGCSGFAQALFLSNKLLEDKDSLALIICSDTYSHHLSKDDRSTQVLFSDGATASIIQGSGNYQIIGSKHLTDGSGADLLSKSIDSKRSLHMDGASVFQWTRRELGKQIKELLNDSKFDLEDIDKYFFHQASKLVLTNIIKSLKIDENKVLSTLNITGNLVSSSIPFLIQNHFNEFKTSKLIVLSGFGVGLSSSSLLIKNVQ